MPDEHWNRFVLWQPLDQLECCAGAKFRLDIAVVHCTDSFMGG
jgi:hypothetical protein